MQEKQLWKTHSQHCINTYGFTFFSVILLLSLCTEAAYGWDNGGYSNDPSNPDYGTHDWIAQHALDWLPNNEKTFIVSNLEAYLYGTELPDNSQALDGIGDTTKHHVYYRADGSLQDDASAIRAQEEFESAVSLYHAGNISEAVKRLGAMTHYISDTAVFAHVMGASTDWGKETHHSDYENYVNQRTNSYDDEFNVFLSFDGTLEEISAYNATLRLALDTTFDMDGDYTCVWMDRNYDWNNLVFRNRCGDSLNLAVNLVTDVLHTFYLAVSSPSTATIIFYVNGSGSDALGNVLIVDGINYTYSDLPKSFTWDIGSTHSFKWMSIVVAETGKRYVWASASGLSFHLEDLIKVPSEGGKVTATYDTKYYLNMMVNPSGGGSVSPGSGWYYAGSSFEIEVTPEVGYKFVGWAGSGLGSYTGLSNPATITMNAPIVETANFEKFDFTISLTPRNGTVQQGETLTATVNITLLSGSPLTVFLSASDFPDGVSVSFTPQPGSPPFTSSLEIMVADYTPAGTYMISIVGSGFNLTRVVTYVLTVKAPESSPQDTAALILILVFITFTLLVVRKFKRR